MKYRLAALVALAFATPAHADWIKAESENFVVYADDSEKDVRHFTEILERYHLAMERLTGRESEPPSPSNRVTIYTVGSKRDVRNLAAGSKFIGGFYIPRAGASAAFVADVRPSSGKLERSMITLLHEYAHHFLIGSSRFAMPVWMNEGGADFFASARFPKDGGVEIGLPASHRTFELRHAVNVPIEVLLSRSNSLPTAANAKYDEFYGRSWALYHYLTFNPERRGQLIAYAKRVAEGARSIDAAREVFGDLDALDDELDRYLKQRKLLGFTFAPDALPISPISVSSVSEGYGQMLPLVIRSKRGVSGDDAVEVVKEARTVASKYPGDANVLAALAEAEQDVGNHDAAVEAADRAIGIDPSIENAYVQIGLALFEKAAKKEPGADADAIFAKSLGAFSALNKIEQDHPLPLIFYYRIFFERGVEPPENAKLALERALELAPFDRGLAMHVALMQARDGRIARARQTLEPVAASPHGDRLSVRAKILLAALERASEGQNFRLGPQQDASDRISDDDIEQPVE